jgi:translocator protein
MLSATTINAALAIVPAVASAALGSLATRPQIAGWYATIIKPSFNPPNWAFGPAWTILFSMMAYAVFRILQLPADTPGRGAALTLFFVELAMNATWSWAFFAMKSPLAGMLIIVPFLLLILGTIALFWPLDSLSGQLLVPYAMWVSFATVLNISIWWLNR